MFETVPSISFAVAVTAPSCRMGGSSGPLACAPATLAPSSRNDNDFTWLSSLIAITAEGEKKQQ